MWVIKYRKLFYTISITLVVASFVSMGIWGLKSGIDFTGGTLIEVSYPEGRPDQAEVIVKLAVIDSSASIRPSTTNEGEEEYIVRMKPIEQEEKSAVISALSLDGSSPVVEKNFSSVGPVLGAEALRKSIVSIILVILAIVLFITFAFRKVAEPVSSWKYGLVAIVTLAHNVIIPTGIFAALGHFANYEVDTLFVTALLVVLGFSVHDTIVVFDRVRENLRNKLVGKAFEEVVGTSISQTFTRSINTSFTTLIALIVLYFVGGPTTEHFALVLIIGIAAGTYSSIFIGSPLLVTIEKWGKK
ncbi:MAG: protein-export membrane protein SecF [Candidatus Taylorbacteria bacterium RIFCSPHIGHO2_01_FULL_44_110]|uniref:Protein-export membrane protein SecF n=1 Tax=Candidatus Taylorbacteria bacterium RIFCSPHIGHO2_12_FULL_45_16 TaxID=1802315 RepID=A0A1G2MY67_9BACT|nr:MAG: protein-export membrane protein SecF [Candidatus Taylorbacteria bacterium RIFCSPHIGHO2_01_FULL_44_110]OHA28778.1 MAG: protein-export membrane protein SecF [Candidatus Taylorbacteria bacterium RIFCSPHIGHO2_12_FULL_45_16]OHA32837.1 MAG: protein-export membrane protein SecF [Candidatus Taylorbacteria bacterium RIFCSPLOWO2_01_FULL_45_59]OHA38239.1 MAG: protein-export membrane protein SecF [Candidatus Taylorbacteria bacterium RIFCSPLOWO2_02_FULL_45_10b]OHA43948.1 MAG: protein-export membrane